MTTPTAIRTELERVLASQALARIERHLAALREVNPLREARDE